ncbi:anti-virulence regulator CigR family protein [Castellaniella sp.]|uniref:anti-virulence regulator CigR family protein n=1 Tax=Castellaniella sp. TaxID=1955812 RepID=UPI002AFFFDAA|nr:anti-virulence regulator CigR family protein [Castellaniella sp.]
MKRRTILAAAMSAGITLALGAQAAPPEGKGQGHGGNPHGNGNKDKGNKGKGNQGQGNQGHSGGGSGDHAGHKGQQASYDSHGRNRDYFDDHRDSQGRLRGGDDYGGLIYAGITASAARGYAGDYGIRGYGSLPPGIRKNLARGKPLPPGIAKKLVPGPLLGRLPRYDGYEWRVAGSDLVLIAIGSAVVADILYDVFD